MNTRSISRACLSLAGLVSASILAGCMASGSESGDDTGVAVQADLPTESYSFDKDIHFCQSIDYGFGSTKLCSPSLSFAGSVSIGDYQDALLIDEPVNALVTVELSEPFNVSTALRVGLLSQNGAVCYGIGGVDGVELKVCANAVDVAIDTSSGQRLYSFKMKLTVTGELEIDGVGISDTVDIYTTPTISVPF